MTKTNHSPVSTQSFVWVADYMDGSHLSEFDFVTQQPNAFNLIDKNKLIRFGLVGYGANLFYEVFGGTFNLAGQMIEVVYKTDDKEYSLTGKQQMYKDIITYKDAEAYINTNLNFVFGGTAATNIHQYNFGYKTDIHYEDVNFHYKAIVCIPMGKTVYINFRLVADKSLRGRLCIKKNGKIVEEFFAPLQENVSGGELNWVVK